MKQSSFKWFIVFCFVVIAGFSSSFAPHRFFQHFSSSHQTVAQTAEKKQAVREEKKQSHLSAIVSSVQIDIPPEFQTFIINWIHQHDEIEIRPNSLFSLRDYMNDMNGGDEQWSFLASCIFKTILPTNFQILERTTSRYLPWYTEIGYDVRVEDGKINFSFLNPNDSTYRLQFFQEDGKLHIHLLGVPFQNGYAVQIENVKYYEPQVKAEYTVAMSKGIYYTKKQGQKGVSADIFRITLAEDGSAIKKEKLFEDFYPSIPQLEVRGTNQDEADSNNQETDKNAAGEQNQENSQESSTDETKTTEPQLKPQENEEENKPLQQKNDSSNQQAANSCTCANVEEQKNDQ